MKPPGRLSLLDVLCLGVNATVGSGVFALPDDLHRAMGIWSPLAYLLCALVLLPVALCFAELSGRYAESGGAYVYARAAFGDRLGYLVGWYCWVNTFVSWAANSTLLGELLGFRSHLGAKLFAVGVTVGLGVVNYYGVKPGAWVVNLVTLGKLCAILCFLAAALAAFDPGRLHGSLPLGLRGVGQGVYLAVFPLQGFEVTPVAAAETAAPRRHIPIATIGALVLSALLFITVQLALIGAYPGLDRVSGQPLVDAARHLGPTLGLLVFAGSIVSVGGFTAGSALGSPRFAQAIASHRLLPARLADIHPRWRTPHVAILFTTGLSAVLAAFFDYRSLVGMSNITVVLQYLATCLALPLVRRLAERGEAPEARWRVPGGVVIAAIGALGSAVLLLGARRQEYLFAALALGVGLVVARLGRGK